MYVNVCIISSVHEGQMWTLGPFHSHSSRPSAFEKMAHSAPGIHEFSVISLLWIPVICLSLSH